MSNVSLASLFGLSGFKIIKCVEYPDKALIHVRPRRKTGDCTKCGKRSGSVHEKRSPQTIKHITLGQKQTHLVVYKRRFWCSMCGKPFTEKVPMVKVGNRHTDMSEREILDKLRESSFVETKNKTGAEYRKQVKILKEFMKPFEANWKKEEKSKKGFSLGFDGHSFSGHDMVLTVTNIDAPRVVSILPSDKKKDIEKFLQSIPKKVKKKINTVVIDMTARYKNSLKKYLETTLIVVDKFHIIQDANKRIDEERLIINEIQNLKAPKKLFLRNKEDLREQDQKRITHWFKKAPDLEVFWFFKEALREMYKSKDKKQAEKRLNVIISGLYKQRSKATSDWAKTLERWKEEILNHFVYYTTNAYTEGMHTKFKLLKRLGYGFKRKDVYIRKMMLACLPITLFLPH